MLSTEELRRYDRQLKVIGVEGQKKIRNTKVLIAGVGGLGSFYSILLAVLGVGRIILIDFDKVELSNLNRQVIHWTSDIDYPKPFSAQRKIKMINPHVEVTTFYTKITEESLARIINDADIVLDGLDNWETRLILDKVAYRARKPLIHAGVYGFEGQVVPINPKKGECLKCLLPAPPKSEKIPIIPCAVAMIASIVISEFIKIITGISSPNYGKMIIIDISAPEVLVIDLRKKENCICS